MSTRSVYASTAMNGIMVGMGLKGVLQIEKSDTEKISKTAYEIADKMIKDAKKNVEPSQCVASQKGLDRERIGYD